MRISRLLAITTYLLNRNIVTGKYLAEKFEVSERTIQRDIEALNMAGIPIVSLKGIGGGYQIMDTFRLLKQPITKDDMRSILIALKGLETTLDNEQINSTLEKMKSISNSYDETMSVDFSAIHENKSITTYLKMLSDTIVNQKVVSMTYINADKITSTRKIEPVMLKYKWYAWYLVAYCQDKQDYRIFKLARIDDIAVTDRYHKVHHIAEERLFEDLMAKDSREYMKIKLSCNKESAYVIKEYIPNCAINKLSDEEYICEMNLPENERMWYGILLSLGTDVKIISPDKLRKRILNHAKKIINFYKGDI